MPIHLGFWGLIGPELLALTGGAALLIAGRRGRQLDDHPICAHCRFDLSGRPDAVACPECGRDVTTQRSRLVGNRRPRRFMVLAGLLLALLGAISTSYTGYREYRVFVWQHHKPVWWLMANIRHGQPGSHEVGDAFVELFDRLNNGNLSDSFVRQTVAQALELQGDATRPWDSRWGDFILLAHRQKLVTAEQIRRYAKQSIAGTVRLEVRPRVRRGDPISYRLGVQGGKCELGGFNLSPSIWSRNSADVTMLDGDAGDVTSNSYNWTTFAGRIFNGEFNEYYPGYAIVSQTLLSPARWAAIKPGRHKISIQVHRKVDTDDANIFLPDGSPPRHPLLYEETTPLEATFEVVDTPTVTLTDDPAALKLLEPYLKSAVVKANTELSDGKTLSWIHLALDGPPELKNKQRPREFLCFTVLARWPGGEATLGHEIGGTVTEWAGLYVIPDTIDIILKPAPEKAAELVDITTLWGHEIILKNIPVQRNASK